MRDLKRSDRKCCYYCMEVHQKKLVPWLQVKTSNRLHHLVIDWLMASGRPASLKSIRSESSF